MLRGMDWNFLKGRWYIDRVYASLSELESTGIIMSEITLVCVKGAGAKFTSTPMAARSAPRYRCHKGETMASAAVRARDRNPTHVDQLVLHVDPPFPLSPDLVREYSHLIPKLIDNSPGGF
jgi:hypothetical protein